MMVLLHYIYGAIKIAVGRENGGPKMLLFFKYALRQCKFIVDSMRDNAPTTSLLSKDSNSFCKHVWVNRNQNMCNPTKVDDW